MDRRIYYAFVCEDIGSSAIEISDDLTLSPIRLSPLASITLGPRFDAVKTSALIQWWQFVRYEMIINVDVQRDIHESAHGIISVVSALLRSRSSAMFAIPMYRFASWQELDFNNLLDFE